MERAGLFLLGFASGWAVRATVDSSRGLAVNLISALYGALDRGSRIIGMEQEHMEDLFAEGRAMYEAARARGAPRAQAARRSEVASRERVA
jgi:hypothetical protein